MQKMNYDDMHQLLEDQCGQEQYSNHLSCNYLNVFMIFFFFFLTVF